MKNFAKSIVLTLTLCLLFSFLAGCSLFVEENEVGEGFTQSTITLYDGESSRQYVAKYGEIATVSVGSKKGYYFDGYFDDGVCPFRKRTVYALLR